MGGLTDLDDKLLLQEYQWSIKRLETLDPALPRPMHDIRATYRDYLAEELARRGVLPNRASVA